MGGPCVRAGKEFVGMPHHKGPGLVVKLSRDRVDQPIDSGKVPRSHRPARSFGNGCW